MQAEVVTASLPIMESSLAIQLPEKEDIVINNQPYELQIFDLKAIIAHIRAPTQFTDSFQDAIRQHRNNPKFQLHDLILEWVHAIPESEPLFFIVTDNDVVVSTARLLYYPKYQSAQINMVWTSPNHRNQKLCQRNLKNLISKTNHKITRYTLEVDIDNKAAIRAYSKVGFINKRDYYNNAANTMELLVAEASSRSRSNSQSVA